MRYRQIAIRALLGICRYPLRSGLLVLSAAIGVAGVVCSVNYGASGNQQILEQIRRLGTNVLIFTPAQSRAVAGRARTGTYVTTLVERDYVAMKKGLLTRTRSSAFVSQSFWNKTADLSKNTTVVSCESDYFAIKDWRVALGALFNSEQERTAARVAVLGHTVAVDLYGGQQPVSKRLLINRVPFTVIGVLSERGQGLDVNNEDNQIYVPLATGMRRLMNVNYYSGILLEVDSMSNMDQVATESRDLLRQLHHVQPNQPEDFQVQNQKALLDMRKAAADRLGHFLIWIAASALIVSGLGIVGISWLAVKERTHEIGTRRALGATAADIFIHTLCETVSLAVSGSLLGISLSWPVSRLVSSAVGLPFVFDYKGALLAFMIAVLLNFGFSFVPSKKAASVRPIEALRYE